MRNLKTIWGVILLFVLPVSVSCAANPDVSVFQKANTAYREGRYAEAAGLYEQYLSEGKAGANPYYNLANSYFKEGKLGKAVLNFERARRIAPRDHDLNANYHYVQSFVKSSGDAPEKNIILKILERYIDLFSSVELAWICLGLVVLASVVFQLGVFLQVKKSRAVLNMIILALMIIFNVAAFYYQKHVQSGEAVVFAPVDAKFEPNESATRHFKLFEGMMVKVLKDEGFWFKIRRADGRTGWIPKSSAEQVAPFHKS